MATVKVKLRDSQSSFYDQSQRKGVFGKQVVELEKTERVIKALKGKHLVETTDAVTEVKAKAESVAKEEVKPEAENKEVKAEAEVKSDAEVKAPAKKGTKTEPKDTPQE